jgi:acyl-CoA thioester hydrolase
MLKSEKVDPGVQLNGDAATIEIPVRFAETDAMGIVHHSAYVIWLEAGRIAWLAAAGAPYAGIAAGGHHFSVTKVELTYRRSVRFGATVLVTTRVVEVRSRQVVFSYTLHERDAAGGAGALLAEGRTEHVCVDLQGRVATIPPHVMALLEAGERERG